MASLAAERIAGGASSYMIYEGTLGDCVKQFMAKPISQRPLYEIPTERPASLDKTVLEAPEIVEIAGRGDFPSFGGQLQPASNNTKTEN
jgi:hypothetical protein